MSSRAAFALLWALMLHLLVLMLWLLGGAPLPQGEGGTAASSTVTLSLDLSGPASRDPEPEPEPEEARRAPSIEPVPADDVAVVARDAQPAPAEAQPVPAPLPEAPSRRREPPEPAPLEPRSAPAQTDSAPATERAGGASDPYLASLRAHLARFHRPLPVHGATEIRVRIGADGRIESLLATRGSADARQAALDLLRRADPLPSPPDGRAISLSVPLEFR